MSDDLTSPLAPTPGAPELSLESLAAAHHSLRTAFHVTLVLLMVLTGSLFVFFLREVSLARRQIGDMTNAIVEYEKTSVPLMEDFRTKLQGFARTHPDFNPVYTKYFGSNSAPSSQSQSSPRAQPVAPSPATARMPPAR
jgi:hypothetical protein